MMRWIPLALAAGLCAALPAATAAPAKPGAKAAAPAGKHSEASLKALEAQLAKKPADAKLKMQVAEASYQVGHTMMYDESLPPRIKYRGALKHFRRAMELNPKHAKAAADRKQIEDIYKSMGMPVPG